MAETQDPIQSNQPQGAASYEFTFKRVGGTKPPAIFMFQPTRFEIVTGDRIQEWETLMQQNVGIGGQLLRSGLPSISFCPFADDCDEV